MRRKQNIVSDVEVFDQLEALKNESCIGHSKISTLCIRQLADFFTSHIDAAFTCDGDT